IALSAIIVPFFLLVLLRMSAAKGMTISAVIVILLAVTVWGMEGIIISSSILQGIHKALTILWILFGALLLRLRRAESYRGFFIRQESPHISYVSFFFYTL